LKRASSFEGDDNSGEIEAAKPELRWMVESAKRVTMLGNVSRHQPLPTNGDQPVASSAYITAQRRSW
jgi:hypothetical protein